MQTKRVHVEFTYVPDKGRAAPLGRGHRKGCLVLIPH